MASAALIVGLLFLGVLVLWFGTRKPKGSGSRRAQAGAAQRSAQVSSRLVRRSPGAASPTPEAAAEQHEPPRALLDFHLICTSELDDLGRTRIEAISRSMPEPHPIHTRLAGGLDSPEELKEAVVSDPGLTASILRTVNSAAFALASPITSVQHAITYLGVSIVKGLVVQAALAERSAEGTEEQQATLRRIWRSAYIASATAQLLGQEIGLPRPSVVATRTLFFNLGDVVFAQGVEGAPNWYVEGSSLFQRVSEQQAVFGANTALVGAALARYWNLPEDLANALDNGLLPMAVPGGELPLDGDERISCVIMYLAGQIGDWATYRGLENVADFPLEATSDPGTHYLRGHLQAAGLARVVERLQDPATRRKINRFIETLA